MKEDGEEGFTAGKNATIKIERLANIPGPTLYLPSPKKKGMPISMVF